MIDNTHLKIKELEQELVELKDGQELIAETIGKVIDTLEKHTSSLTHLRDVSTDLLSYINKQELSIDHVHYEMMEEERARAAKEEEEE